ncbi:unnamed protein product [Protopolystoma xenopodis]|uniref:Uncharacterized protein n=1 Tax=Protopolystoma xenopodis TaxID=117903 RepID=A0A3S5AYU0_9PLAT|nr:unnamed protein product [Protopolystoma xenopodis]
MLHCPGPTFKSLLPAQSRKDLFRCFPGANKQHQLIIVPGGQMEVGASIDDGTIRPFVGQTCCLCSRFSTFAFVKLIRIGAVSIHSEYFCPHLIFIRRRDMRMWHGPNSMSSCPVICLQMQGTQSHVCVSHPSDGTNCVQALFSFSFGVNTNLLAGPILSFVSLPLEASHKPTDSLENPLITNAHRQNRNTFAHRRCQGENGFESETESASVQNEMDELGIFCRYAQIGRREAEQNYLPIETAQPHRPDAKKHVKKCRVSRNASFYNC